MAIKETIIVEVEDINIEQTTKKVNDLSKATKEVSESTSTMAGEMRGASNSVLENGGAMGLLNDATSGYAMMVKDAVEASVLFTKSQRLAALQQKAYSLVVGTSTGAMKAFRIALISTGVGAIVVALGLLIANFDKVKKAVLNLVPGLAIIGEAFGQIINAVTDFIGVTSDASRALDKMVADSEASLKRNEIFLEANGDKFDEYTQRKIKANIDYNKKVKELAEDETFTEEEKLKLLAQFREKANREIVAADKDRNDKLQKARDEEAAKLDEANKRALEERKKRIEAQRKLEEEEAARRQKISEEANAQEAANIQNAIDKEVELQIQKDEILKGLRQQSAEELLDEEEVKQLKILELANATQEEIFAVQMSFKAKRDDLEAQKAAEAEAKAKEDAEKQKQLDESVMQNRINVATQTANLIAELAGEGSAIAKGVAVAQATIDTYKGAVSAYSAMAGIPIVGPGLGAVAAGAVVAAGIANVKKILATKPVENSAPSGASAGNAPAAPSFNLVQGTGANQIATSITQQQQPVQAFVVSSNVTTAQSMDRNIVENSSL